MPDEAGHGLLSQKTPRALMPFYGESLVLLCSLLFCVLLSRFLFASILSVAIFIVWLLLLSYRHPPFILKYLYVFFSVVAAVAGCCYIEFFSPLWLPELQIHTAFVGSLPLLIFGNWLLVTAIFWMDIIWGCENDSLRTPRSPNRENAVNAFAWIALVITILAFVNVMYDPSFARGVDRFAYDALHSGNLIVTISSKLLPYLILASILAVRAGKRALGLVSVFFYCLFLFWTGEKFGGYFLLACEFALVFYDRIYAFAKESARKLMAVLACVVVLLVGLACFAYSFTSSDSIDDFLEYRVAAQGQLWWATYEKLDGSSHPEEIWDEVTALRKDGNNIPANVGSNNGIYKMMYFTAPQSVVDSKLARGSRYSGGGFATAYYYGGVLGVTLFSCVSGLLISLITNALVRAFRDKRIIDAFLLLRLFLLSQITLGMFLFSVFLEPITILSLIWLLGGWLSRKSRRRYKVNLPYHVSGDHT